MNRAPRTASLAVGLLLIAATSGCGMAGGSGLQRTTTGTSGAVIVQGEELWAFGGRLLDGLRGRVSSLQVSRTSGSCPTVQLRGQRTILGETRPTIYVDGTRMNDTCILDQLRVGDVKRVEIYRGGVSGRTGYSSGPNGLIAVFLVDGQN